MLIHDFVQHLPGVTSTARGYRSLCPVHGDKNKPNLYIDEGSDGRILVRCHACEADGVAVCKKLGLSPKVLFPETKGSGQLGELVCEYVYNDEMGKPLFKKQRYVPKDFRLLRYEDGRWEWGMKGTSAVLYRLPEVRKAISEGQTVFIVEGEKDADNLVKLGVCATTGPYGGSKNPSTKKWTPDFTFMIREAKRVVVGADRDADGTGQAFAAYVGEHVHHYVQDVRVIEFPGDGVKDASDWIQKGGSLEQLLALVEAAPVYTPNASTAAPSAFSNLPSPEAQSVSPVVTSSAEEWKDDLSNGRKLGEAVRDTMRWHCENEEWWRYDGKRWVIDTERGIVLLYDDMIAAMPPSAWRNKSREAKHVRAAIDFARSHVPLHADELDVDPWAFNCANGTLDLRTGELRPHSSSNLISKLSPVAYDPTATCPQFEKFVWQIMGGDIELVAYLKRLFGYSLTAEVLEEALTIFHGTGRNGKSTLLEIIRHILGTYAQNADFKTFIRSKSERIRTDLARMPGARLVTASESAEDQQLDEQLVKTVTGRDKMTARFLYGREFEFYAKAKVILSCNHKPTVQGMDIGFWRRLQMVPFTVTVSPQEPNGLEPPTEGAPKEDKGLRDRLIEQEAPGILAWLVQGCASWRGVGLKPPQKVLEATQAYRDESDTVSFWLMSDSVTVVMGKDGKPDETATVEASRLYAEYRRWCERTNSQSATQTSFGLRLSALGHVVAGASNKTRRRIGLRLPERDPVEVPF